MSLQQRQLAAAGRSGILSHNPRAMQFRNNAIAKGGSGSADKFVN